jgi:hypothetical protein
MKIKSVFLVLLVLILYSSCIEEDVIYIDGATGQVITSPTTGNGSIPTAPKPAGQEFPEGNFIRQIGPMTLSNNLLRLPLRSKNVPLSAHRIDVVIFQDGAQLRGGPWAFTKDATGFFRSEFDVDEELTPLHGRNIRVDVYRMDTPTGFRNLVDTLIL